MKKDLSGSRSPENGNPAKIIESHHPEFPLEWWFVHGYFKGKTLSRRYFMTSFFRFRLHGSHDAHSFLLAQLDTDAGVNKTVSRIDRSVIDQFAGLDSRLEEFHLDSHLAKAYLRQYQRSESLREIDLDDSPIIIRSDPLTIRWSDYSLDQKERFFQLKFRDPASETPYQFSLYPAVSKSLGEASLKCYSNLQGMEYFSYPRLDLEGQAGDMAVKGEAWLDHQWGRFGWIVESAGQKKILGWDWFGLHLDDGSAWVFIAHRDAQTGDILDKHVIYRDGQGAVRSSAHFDHQPLRSWESPRTAISYPVEWLIRVPDFDAEFAFSAYHDDQEIRVFGPIRSVWEGAGRVTGKLAGRRVTGWGRGELHGYGYIFNYRDYMGRLAARIGRHIEAFIPKKMDASSLHKYLGAPSWDYEPEAYTEMLSSPVWDLASRKGKRWRPIFALLLLDALGKTPQPYESLVSNLAELAHSGSLIIDDIQDHSFLRRGKECIHIKYGQDVAISSANSLYFLAFHLLFGHPHLTKMQQLEIHEIIIRNFTRAHFGQALDLYWTRNLTESNLHKWMSDSLGEKIFQMYELKTSTPVEGLAEAAAVIAEAAGPVRQACLDFARAFGIAFQIIDDINNFSNSSEWRKKQGEDLAGGKLSYVIFKALQDLSASRRIRLEALLTDKGQREDPACLAEGVDLVRQSGVLQKCRKQAADIVEPSWQHLEKFLEPSEPRLFLQTMYHSLLNLSYDL